LVERARAAQITLKEIQIDHDSPESRLDRYRGWVEAIRRAVAPVPVTITALPSWLRAPEFRRLAEAVDGYVLQVHSLDPPGQPDKPAVLCAADAAMRAVDEAGALGIPFRVALPTFGYRAAIAPGEKLVGVTAEGPETRWPAGVRVVDVRADAGELADLVAGWSADRPAALQGLIWYRLPVEGDRRNWAWPTLDAVMAGRRPKSSVRVEARRPEAALVELVVVNDGEADAPFPKAISLTWAGGRRLAADGLAGYDWVDLGAQEGRLSLRVGSASPALPPGRTQMVGWLRLEEDAEVEASVTTTTS